MANIFHKYVDVLNLFLNDQDLVRLDAAEVGQRLGIPKATAWRLCKDLEGAEMLAREGDMRYRLGPWIPRAFEVLRRAEIAVARRYKEMLATEDTESTEGGGQRIGRGQWEGKADEGKDQDQGG